MGHSDPETTRRYTHATDRAKKAAVEAVRITGISDQRGLPQFCHNAGTATIAGGRK